jgi:peptide/nickel transport system substrate-binding protein
MISRAHKLRFRRLLRLRRLQVEELGLQAEEGLERNFFKRLERLVGVRRFVASWLLLLFLLAGIAVAQISHLNMYYQSLQPAPGGTYSEGILGAFTNANPIYAQSAVDTTVSHLMFAGLFTYNDQNQLVGDLADSISNNTLGTVYTVHLRPHLTWQDGQPLTANDVAFTYHVIQNPDAQSPLYNSWQHVSVAATNPTTITFTLSNPLASFPYSLTNGIIPQHLLASVPMADMRSAEFNTDDPVGSGPFAWSGIAATENASDTQQEVQIALKPFAAYHGGKPKLDGFIVRTFDSQSDLVSAFRSGQVSAMVGLDQVPKNLQHDSSVWAYNMPQTAAVMTFFRTTDGVLSDTNVRQALVQASNTQAIIGQLGYPAEPVVEPLLHGQLGFNPIYAQASYNSSAAAATLSADGWVLHSNGIRYKNGVPLTFKLYTEDTSEYDMVAHMLVSQWRAVGVDAQVVAQNSATFQNTLTYHEYDALLCGISIGVDPDVFVYWDSAEADIRSPQRLNFSEYSNATVDNALEAGRTRLNPAERVVKYQAFLQQWQKDAPALGLYQSRFLYITRGPVYGLTEHTTNTDTDRFDNVQNWEIREQRVSE